MQGLELDDDFLCAEARKWELHHGGISGAYSAAVY